MILLRFMRALDFSLRQPARKLAKYTHEFIIFLWHKIYRFHFATIFKISIPRRPMHMRHFTFQI